MYIKMIIVLWELVMCVTVGLCGLKDIRESLLFVGLIKLYLLYSNEVFVL